MQTCEKCGARFAPPAGPVEVTTTRILCPACRAAREAEKHRGEGGTPLPPPRPAAMARPPLDAATPASRAPAARDAKQPAHSERAVLEAAARARAKPSPAARPAPAHSPEKAHKKGLSIVFQEDAERLRKRKNRTTLYGFLVVLGLGAVAGTVVWRVLSIKGAEQQAEQARIDKQEGVYGTITGFSLEVEEECQKLVDFAEQEENQRVWKGDERASEIQGRLAKAKGILQGFKDRREITGRFQELAAKAQGIAALTSDDVAQLKRDLETLDARAAIVGDEFVQQLAGTIKTVDEAYSAKLIEEARAAAQDLSTPESARAALGKYARAEEETQKALDVAYRAWQTQRSNGELTEQKDRAESLYKEVVRESDELGAKIYTEEFIEKTPWLDLLSGEWAAQWNSATVKGFSHTLENGVLQLVGPDPDARGDGAISIGDHEQWRDFRLEMEITLIKGSLTLFMRLGSSVENVENFELNTEGDNPFPANEPLTVEIDFRGSVWTLYIHSENYDPGSPTDYDVSWTSSREGAIGFGIPSGAQFKVTKMRVKVLR